MTWVLLVLTILAWLVSGGLGISVLSRRGLIAKLRRLALSLIMTGVAVLLSALLVFVQAFHAFSRERRVATVMTRWLSSENFELTYTPAFHRPGALASGPDATNSAPAKLPDSSIKTVRLRGDQWSISGGIVKWHPWLTALGIPSYHKPRWLSGQFSDLAKQRIKPPAVFPLEPDTDWVWEACYRLAPSLPFVEAVYGSTAYVYVEPDVVQEIYVTPSGYIIKRKF